MGKLILDKQEADFQQLPNEALEQLEEWEDLTSRFEEEFIPLDGNL